MTNLTVQISKGLRSVRSKLVECAEPYAERFFSVPVDIKMKADRAAEFEWMDAHMKTITNQEDHQSCFLHEHEVSTPFY